MSSANPRRERGPQGVRLSAAASALVCVTCTLPDPGFSDEEIRRGAFARWVALARLAPATPETAACYQGSWWFRLFGEPGTGSHIPRRILLVHHFTAPENGWFATGLEPAEHFRAAHGDAFRRYLERNRFRAVSALHTLLFVAGASP